MGKIERDAITDDEYIRWLEGYKEWYESSVDKWHFFLIATRSATIITSLSSAMVSIFLNSSNAQSMKWIVTILSLLGTAFTYIMAEFKIARMEGLREEGRVETQHLVIYARDKLEQFPLSNPERFKIKDEIRTRITNLEKQQGKEFSRLQAGDAGQFRH